MSRSRARQVPFEDIKPDVSSGDRLPTFEASRFPIEFGGNERNEEEFAGGISRCDSSWNPQAISSAMRTSGQRSPDRLHSTDPKRSRRPNEM